MRGNLLASGLFLLTFNSPVLADIKDDALLIISGNSGQITRWSETPNLAIFHEIEIDKTDVQRPLSIISENTPLNFGQGSVTYIDLNQIDYLRGPRFRFNRRQNATDSGTFSIDGKTVVEANIFVFVADQETSAFFNILIAGAKFSGQFPKRLAMNEVKCYFTILKDDDVIQLAYVFISSSVSQDRLASCLYEEIVQAMGLPADAENTPHFSFDDNPGFKDPNSDKLLLQTVYHADVLPGDPAIEAIEYFGFK